MTYSLPNLSIKEAADLVAVPYFITTCWLSRLSTPPVYTSMRCMATHHKTESLKLFFELVHTDVWNGVFQTFRTGTVRVLFDERGEAYFTGWEAAPIDNKHAGILCRPLWLPSQFWDALPEVVRHMDSDFTDDPFNGAADFTPVKAAVIAPPETVPQPTAHIRTSLSLGKLPTLNDIVLQMYGAFEGEHVQFVSPLGSLKIRRDGCLVASFDLWNPSGRYVKTDMWHAGHFEIVFNERHEIESVEHSEESRSVDHPYAYRYAPHHAPHMLWRYIDGLDLR